MKRFYVQGGEILAGPYEVTAQPETPFYLRPGELKLGEKTPERLLELGWLPEEVVGYEPFDPKTQIRTGPVRTIQQNKVVSTYTVRDKTAQEVDAEKETAAQVGIGAPQNKAIRDALWELHRAIRGEITLPSETKGAYSARLKDIWKGYA